jgi:large subunit ribosomal protein L15
MAETEKKQQPILSRLSPPKGAVKGKRRLGRGHGSGLGTTAGKGQKGQLARGGGQVRRGFEGGQTPLHRRLPKIGFKNPFTKQVAIVNVGNLAGFDAGATVDPEALAKAGLVRGTFDSIKVLGAGALDKALTVRAHAFSASAKELIEKAGGKAEVLEAAKPAEG